MSFLSEIFSNYMKAKRLKLGLNQEDAAAKIGTDPANVSRWESGKHIPTEKLLNEIAEAYDLTAENFFGDEYEKALLVSFIVTNLGTMDQDQLRFIKGWILSNLPTASATKRSAT